MKSQDEQWLLQEKYQGEKTAGFFADCKALALGEPLAYLIGHTPFLDCTIHLGGRPLIPRVETEFWVEKAIAAIQESVTNQDSLFQNSTSVDEHLQILDLCAGSGCIGVAVAHKISSVSVDFAEIDARLLPTIQKNIDTNVSSPDRCHIFHSNLFAALPPERKYNIILSNPPYIDPALNRVDDSVQDFEPHLALFGGEAGVEIIEQLIITAPDRLSPGGQLWIEHEPEQAPAISNLANQHGFRHNAQPDQYDVIRYSVLVLE